MLDWRTTAFAVFCLAALGLVPTGAEAASTKSSRDAEREGGATGRGKPLLAIVALGDQRITIYGADGKMLQAPVSTGSTGYETPAGIYSIVQKKEEHRSNLYEDGEMPFMQRITWTGIALHAGALPGHPASHGCVRLPLAFARDLFGITEMGMRVVVVRDDITPSAIDHPALFRSRPVRKELALASPEPGQSSARNAAPTARLAASAAEAEVVPGSPRHLDLLRSIAAAKSAEAEAAAKRERPAKQAAAAKAGEAAAAVRQLRAAEGNRAKADAQLKDAERLLESASTPEATGRAEAAKVKALARIDETERQLQAARTQADAKTEVAERATEEARAASSAKEKATEVAEDAGRLTSPVSVFVSRKTRRLYIRKANYPIYEGPVGIRDADQPLGTFIYTALQPINAAGETRWNVTSMYRDATNPSPPSQESRRRGGAPSADAARTDVAAAKAALDRVSIPQEALERIGEVILPGSSLIVSDEGPSRETGKDTDFVVLMSGEPQGALKARMREPMLRDPYSSRRSPYGGFPFFTWN
jgi:hypothetical protein